MEVLRRADFIQFGPNSVAFSRADRASVVAARYRTLSQTSELGRDSNLADAIVAPVWEELRLIKYDCHFHLCLSNFATEMMQRSEADLQAQQQQQQQDDPATAIAPTAAAEVASAAGGDPLASSTGSGDIGAAAERKQQLDPAAMAQRVAALSDLLQETALVADEYEASQAFSSGGAGRQLRVERLLDAQEVALELRTFRQREPSKSPQDIINRVARTKKNDIAAGLPSYMSLLIYEISQMSNVLDFPLNLQVIQREIVNGQRYLNNPVGHLDISNSGMGFFSGGDERCVQCRAPFAGDHGYGGEPRVHACGRCSYPPAQGAAAGLLRCCP